MIILCGDTHFRSEEPFLSAQKDFWLHCAEAEWNRPENVFIHLGDFYHSSALNGELASFGLDFWNSIHAEKILLQGNHDSSKRLGSALIHLKEAGVRIIDEPTVVKIEGNKVLCLPYFYPSNEGNMRETYSSISETPDLLVGHFADQFLFGEEIDISYLNCPKVLGHVHIPGGNYIGVPIATSYAERGQRHRLMSFSNGQLKDISIPTFLEYGKIDFHTSEVEGTVAPHMIWDVVSAPSIQEGREKFKDVKGFEYIRKVELGKKVSNSSIEEKEVSKSSSLLDLFLKEKEVSEAIRDRLVHHLSYYYKD